MAELPNLLGPVRKQRSRPRTNILLVDDNPANLLALRAILDDLDQNLVEANSGEDALRQLRSDDFAVILLDVYMPGMDGFETAKQIRKHQRSTHTPIIFQTAYDIDRLQLEKGYTLGAVDFLVKPVLPIVLQAKVAGFVELFEEKQRAKRDAEQLRLLVEGTQDYAIFLLDPLGNVASWNAGAERIQQYRAHEIIGQHFSRFYPQDAIDRGWPAHELTIAKAEGRFEDEGLRVRKDGTQFWANVVITALYDEAGTFKGFSKITRDLTERRKSEENARRLAEEAAARRVAEENARLIEEQRERLYVTLASIGDAVITTDTEGHITNLNGVAEALTGWANHDAVGQPLENVFRIVNEDTRQPVENLVTRALREGVIIGLATHTILIARDGTERAIDDSAAPIRYQEGEVIGCVLIFRDVTEQRRAETVLRRQASLLEQTHDAIFVWEFPGPILYWNQTAEQLYGFPQEETLGKISHDLLATVFPQQDRVAFEAALNQHGEFRGELIHTKKNGERITVESRIRLLTEADGKRLVLETSRDITERKAAEEEQRRLLAALSEADRRKDEFLATLAHELRNPLAPIRNSLQLMRMASGKHEAVEQARIIMERQLTQLVRLVDDLLDMSRISQGKIELRRERVRLAAVLNSAVETSSPLIEEMGHQLTVTLPGEAVVVDADLTRLAQAFLNLLNNSAKYTDRGGRIWLTVERQGSDVVVSVKDTGIGIAADQLPRLFEMFSQLSHSLERSQGGLGIGLTLVKRLVEMHGGRIEARSDGPGKGAEFIVRLPVVVEASVPQVGVTKEEGVVNTSLRILIVDDNRDGADSLAMMLKMMGNDTRTAYDGEAAVAAVDFRPNVILLDIGLPKLNGYAACRRIREQPGGREIVIIAQTGWGQEEDRQRTHEAGFDHHMVKPVDPTALMNLLAGLQGEKVKLLAEIANMNEAVADH